MNAEDNQPNKQTPPQSRRSARLGVVLRISGKTLGSVICPVVFAIVGALYGIVFPWTDCD